MATTRRKTAGKPEPKAKAAVRAAVKTASAAKPLIAEAPAAPLKPTPVAAAVQAVAVRAKAARTAKVPKAEKADKPKKPKLVRDSFTIPKAEYAVLEALKERAAKAGSPAKKSEVLRAGIKALAGLSDTALLAALKDVPALKTGRPAKV